MFRLINTEEFIKRIDHYPPNIRDVAKKELRYCKTVDAVPVVRCKNCKHSNVIFDKNWSKSYRICEIWDCASVIDNGFCVYGEDVTECSE